MLLLVVAYQNPGMSYRRGAEFSMEKILQLSVVKIPSELYVSTSFSGGGFPHCFYLLDRDTELKSTK